MASMREHPNAPGAPRRPALTALAVAATVVGTVLALAGPASAVGPDAAVAADAGGPYTVVEGQPLALDASASTGGDGSPLNYSWDLNGDGVFGDATGVAPVLSWSRLGSLSINDGPSTFHPVVQVDDGQPGEVTNSAPTTLTIVNAPPVAVVAGSPTATGGLTVKFVLSANDPSALDQAAGFRYAVSWGDGSVDDPFHAPGAVLRPHSYAAPGSYTVSLTATDKDGATSAVASKTVTVAELVADGGGGSGQTLLVGGSPGDDTISVTAPTGLTSVTVTVDGVSEQFPGATVTSVVVTAGDGDDTVSLSGPLPGPGLVYGQAGNDTLSAGDDSAVLVGGDGDDTLSGGPGRDVLIGGRGADVLRGNGGSDLLAPGATELDQPDATDEAGLSGVRAEWARPGEPELLRVLHLLGLRGGLNGSTHFVLAGRRRNVTPPDCGDRVPGITASDWYLAGL